MTIGDGAAYAWLASGAVIGVVRVGHDMWFLKRQGVCIGTMIALGVTFLCACAGPLSAFMLRCEDS